SLINDFVCAAKLADFTVPAEAGVAAILHKVRSFSLQRDHLLEMLQGNVAHSKQSRAASIALLPHCFPDFSVGIAPAVSRGRAVQNVTIDMISAEMFERTGHRLRNLDREAGRGIVGKAMVLPGTVSEFCLQKKIGARDYSGAIGGGQSLTDSLFEIMPALVGRIDAAKTSAQRQFYKGWGSFFFPGGAVEKIRNGRGIRSGHA